MTLADRITTNYSASFWLKNAVKALAKRDCVDALHDAEALVEVCQQRCDKCLDDCDVVKMAQRSAERGYYGE